MEGWIAIHRKLLSDVVWKKSTPEQKTVLISILLLVDHQSNEWEWSGVKFKTNPGQTVTSLASIVKACGKGITTQNVRSALKRFKKLHFLTDKATKSGRLITIINWSSYQDVKTKGNKDSNKEVTKTQQRGNKDLTPNNNETMKPCNNKYRYPDNFSQKLQETFNNFIANRIVLKKPVTELAFTGLVNKLNKLSGGNESSALEIIENSIVNGWSGFFELKNKPFKQLDVPDSDLIQYDDKGNRI